MAVPPPPPGLPTLLAQQCSELLHLFTRSFILSHPVRSPCGIFTEQIEQCVDSLFFSGQSMNFSVVKAELEKKILELFKLMQLSRKFVFGGLKLVKTFL